MQNDWKEQLETFFKERDRGLENTRQDAREFFDHRVKNAFSSLQKELEKYGHRVRISSSGTSDSLFVLTGDDDEFVYKIEAEVLPDRVSVVAQSSISGRYHVTSDVKTMTDLLQ